MNFNDKWKAFLNESHAREEKTLTEEEIALIAEGRKEDAAKKYPGITRFIDRLASLDPSKNNKYLMWMAKQLNFKMQDNIRIAGDDAPPEGNAQDAYFADLFNYTIRIGEAMEEFHKNVQRLKNRDINSYKTLKDVEDANAELGFSKRQKRKGEKVKALEDTEIVFENDYFYIARPYTVEAAAELGGARGATSWCIARGKCGDQWFTKYTGQGKTFYYVISKFLPKPPKNTSSLQALTYIHGQLHWINDGDNKEIDEGDFEQNLYEVMFAGAVANAEAAVEAWNDMSTNEPTPEIIQKVITALVRDFGGEYDEDIEDVTDVDEIYDIGNRIISSINSDIMYVTQQHAEDNPSGYTEADFESVLNEFGFEHVMVDLQDATEWGGTGWSWDASAEFRLPEDLPWVDTGDGQPAASDYEDEILTIFKDASESHGDREPDEAEYEDYEEGVRLLYRPGYGEGPGEDEEGDIQSFKDFCNAMSAVDQNYSEIMAGALEEIKSQGLIQSDEYNAHKEIHETLPDLKNFETKLEKGVIKIFTKFDLDITGFLKAINFHDLKDDREDHQRAEAQPSVTQRAYMNRMSNNLIRELGGWYTAGTSRNSDLGELWIKDVLSFVRKVAAQKHKQMSLPLQESEGVETITNMPLVTFLAPKIEVSPGEKIKGTILIELPLKFERQRKEDTIHFVAWVDKFFNETMTILRNVIIEYSEKLGRDSKQHEPGLFSLTPDEVELQKERERKREANEREGLYLMRTPGGLRERNRREAGEPPRIHDPQAGIWIDAPPAWEPGMLVAGEPLPEDWTWVPGNPTPQAENKRSELLTNKALFENWRKFLK